jgi:hypothetical protein
VREFDVVILGAGAAGLMCAIEAGRRGRRTLLLDHADRIGNKILISGGGRANFTNLHCTQENFLSENPHFARSALARFTPEDIIALVEAHGISYHEKTLGQLFCDRSARDLVTLLERECRDASVQIEVSTQVLSLTRTEGNKTARFELSATSGTLRASSVVVATGGLSIPKMGATGLGYDLARQFGLRIVDPRPALVPLTFGPEDREIWCDLAGVSTEVVARTLATGRSGREQSGAPEFREKMLFTHRGLSGPAILQISSYWGGGQELAFDLAPGTDVLAALRCAPNRRDATAVLTALRSVLPARLAERCLVQAVAVGAVPLGKTSLNKSLSNAMSNAMIAQLERRLHAWRFRPAGTEGFAKAEVTAGGVDTAELNAQTLESRKVSGLYFIGEVVDVTGWLGGYNFQWAWASGFCAGQSA